MGTVININLRGRTASFDVEPGGPGQLQLDLNGKLLPVHTLAEASDICKVHSVAGELVDDGETLATISALGVIRDLDQKVINL